MTQNYLEQLSDPTHDVGDRYDPRKFPKFYQVLQTHFPGAMPMEDCLQQTAETMSLQGFTRERTLAMVALCRDPITAPLMTEIQKYWDRTCNCCSLAGFMTAGRTGLKMATDQIPIADGVRRLAFYAMPHLAISENGDIGRVYHGRLRKNVRACGTLEAIVDDINSGYLNLALDLQDIEQSIIRQKVFSTLYYGNKLDLVKITKLACQMIADDVRNLLMTLERSQFESAVMVAIQIHGPQETHWIYPKHFYLMDDGVCPHGTQLSLSKPE